ncbi:MAG: uroporphyrinogen decarboxylase [Gammaproteobacteria bacterium]|nr:MAG: uroporphyrinogen decarboxylase [Gammaproteobacteria bacterium]
MDQRLHDSAFLRACRGEPTPHTPIWLNRQAGRYMPEYHQVKGKTPSLAFFKNPDLAAQATLDAQRILGVDAAILFADLLPILEPMGLDLDYVEGVGPVFANPLRSPAAIDALRPLVAEEGTGYIADTVRNCRAGLPADIPLIGFAGAPFTLASYAVEGRGSRNYIEVKKLMYSDPASWDRLMNKLVDAVADYLGLQIRAGVQAVQLFDSWVGCLSPADYVRYAQPYTRNLITRLHEHGGGAVPVIHFGTGNPALNGLMHAAGGDVLALDWRSPLVATWDAVGAKAVQGNMDPIILCADWAAVETQARALLDEVDGRPGHIFNLGHGIVPETPVDNVKRLVNLVHEATRR